MEHGFNAQGALPAKGYCYRIIMRGSWFISGSYSCFERRHGVPPAVPAAGKGSIGHDFMTIMFALNDSVERSEVTDKIVQALREDHAMACEKFAEWFAIAKGCPGRIIQKPPVRAVKIDRAGGYHYMQSVQGRITGSLIPQLFRLWLHLGDDIMGQIANRVQSDSDSANATDTEMCVGGGA